MHKNLNSFIEHLIFVMSIRTNASNRPDGKFLARTEKRLISSTVKIFRKQQAYVLSKIKNISGLQQSNIITNSIEDEIEVIVDGIPQQTQLTETIVASMKTGINRGGIASVRNLKLGKFGITWSLRNKEAIKFLEAKRTLELSNYKGNITGTTKTRISEILLDAAKSGQSYEKTAQLIMQQGEAGVFSQSRAQLIATREIGVSYEEGNRIPIDEFAEKYPDRIVEKHWSTVGDNNVTEECEENQDAGWLGLDEEFPSGDQQAPREGNPRCRCTTEYEIRDAQ